MQLAIVNSLFRDSSLVKVPRFIQAALRTKKTTLTLEQCLRVAQNPDFTPVWEGQKKGRFGDKEKRTRVYVANNWLPLLPVVYYVNLAGFVVACHRRWVSTEKATEYLNKGTGEVIGHRSWKSGGTRVDSWMVRSYKLLLSAPDPDNYRFVNLSDEDCNGATVGQSCGSSGMGNATREYAANEPDTGYESSLRESTKRLEIMFEYCKNKKERRRMDFCATNAHKEVTQVHHMADPSNNNQKMRLLRWHCCTTGD
ncbi:hypothetical protein FisN_5Hu087 [Fistulifera solaris]|uniref:Uncharacterized protein n=1 Tax=Fistulifera solaris TaxID=1519565 RepID=A0A1Z5JU32_FISSO|nr:hypothetical protein FisN_5Hu087 [Fistulifera solaris]|eukprot:GAX17439.1 hypothetical protein FisN_5Hu087 [Fistulifera solaris]